MRTLPKILGACAVAALVGSAAWASSSSSQHRLTVWLPGGGTEQITYMGDVAPRISITPSDFTPASFWSPSVFNAVAFDGMPMGRIAAVMDADMASMISQADAMMAMPMPAFNGVTEANLNAMAPGSQSYSVVSTMTGNNICTRSVEITSGSNGHAPQVMRHSSGNCAATPDNSVLFHTQPAQSAPLMTVRSNMAAFAPSHRRI